MEPLPGIDALKTAENARLKEFEQARPRLLGLAYRMLGSLADAEDVVQDCYIAWLKADRLLIQNPQSWLMTTCSRECLDKLRSAQRKRVEYVGAWLPEPVDTASNNPEEEAMLASSLTTAFLLMLERLKPKERAAYLLHDVFDEDYGTIAEILQVQETSCRKLVSRARDYIKEPDIRYQPDKATQQKLLDAFRQAITHGEMNALTSLLTEDAAFTSDGGGKVVALANVLRGRDAVMRFIRRVVFPANQSARMEIAEINSGIGLKIFHGDQLINAYSFVYNNEGLVTNICAVRNPDKLARLGTRVVE